MWQGGEGQRGPGAEIDGPLCPPLRPRPGALCAGAAETCWVLFPILGAQGKRRGVRGPLIRASRAGQPECRGIIATCSAISLDCRGRGRPRPPSPAGPAAGSPVARPVPARRVPLSPPRRSRGGLAASAVRVPPGPEPRREGRTPAERRGSPGPLGHLERRGDRRRRELSRAGPGPHTCPAATPALPRCFQPSWNRRDGRGPGARCVTPCPSAAHRVLPVTSACVSCDSPSVPSRGPRSALAEAAGND